MEAAHHSRLHPGPGRSFDAPLPALVAPAGQASGALGAPQRPAVRRGTWYGMRAPTAGATRPCGCAGRRVAMEASAGVELRRGRKAPEYGSAS